MGKLKGKVVAGGNTGMLKYTNDAGQKVEYKYDQPFSLELGIGLGTRVTFDLVTAPDGTNVAVAVAPINKGEITEIVPEKGTGSLVESESGIKYTIRQNYLRESRFEVGQVVIYQLVRSGDVLYATALSAAREN
jgi:hypothetical protein